MLLKEFHYGNIHLKNRLVRAATYEGMADEKGYPGERLRDLYAELAANGTALIITGFAHISVQGRAMQPFQSGIDSDEKIGAWSDVARAVHRHGGQVMMQIAHTGRQTISRVTGQPVVAPSAVTCTYFREKPRSLKEPEIRTIIEQFTAAARRAQKAGLDGVQIHAAHGYLLHQFLSSYVNRRRDRWGGSLENRFRLLREVLTGIRAECGPGFMVFVKLSPLDDRVGASMLDEYVTVAGWLEEAGADAIEVSYGMMEKALNIIRGGCPVNVVLRENILYRDIPPLLKKLWKMTVFPVMKRGFKPFTGQYNLSTARRITSGAGGIPVIPVGGFRRGREMARVLADTEIDLVSLCRPFICEPDLVKKLTNDAAHVSRCVNCNLCTVYCDSRNPLRCWLAGNTNVETSRSERE